MICYLMSGDAHMPYLAVSLHTLRRCWQGQVVLYAYPESYTTAVRVAADSRLAVEVRLWEPVYRGKNGQFINKLVMMQRQDENTLYLDADTIIQGTPDRLFEECNRFGFVATQFCQWMANSKVIKNRVGRLQGRNVPQTCVTDVPTGYYPSVNGGVFACDPKSTVLEKWFKYTMEVKDIFIADETVLHIMMSLYENSGKFTVLTGGAYNCSPKYQPKTLPDDEVKIWHGHGDCFVRRNKSEKGVKLWWPLYQECLDKNVGGIQEWIGGVENKFLTELQKENF